MKNYSKFSYDKETIPKTNKDAGLNNSNFTYQKENNNTNIIDKNKHMAKLIKANTRKKIGDLLQELRGGSKSRKRHVRKRRRKSKRKCRKTRTRRTKHRRE